MPSRLERGRWRTEPEAPEDRRQAEPAPSLRRQPTLSGSDAADDGSHRRHRGREVRGARGLFAVGRRDLCSDAVVHDLLDPSRCAAAWSSAGVDVARRAGSTAAGSARSSSPTPSSWPGSRGRSTHWSPSGWAWLGSLPAETEVAVVEVPLLFEGGGAVFDTTVAVVAEEEVRRERAAARGHALVDEREARQLTQEEKARGPITSSPTTARSRTSSGRCPPCWRSCRDEAKRSAATAVVAPRHRRGR